MDTIAWIDDLKGDKWTKVWRNKIYCGNCVGIIDAKDASNCTFCGHDYHSVTYKIPTASGEEEVPAAFMGAIPMTAHLVLNLMQDEWNRPTHREALDTRFFKTSPKAIIVILFWTLFENLISDLLKHGMNKLPKPVSEHLLKKHQNISDRLDNLYPV